MTSESRSGGSVHHPRRVSAKALVCLACGAIGLAAWSSQSPANSVPVSVGASAIATPLATSVETADGTWSTVPMGHLREASNTFWQLFFRANGSSSWSDDVKATAVATNGGILLASTGGHSLLVGVRPSGLLKFSPLIATNDAGNSWSNGLLSKGLAGHPGALAADADGQDLALVSVPGGTQVLTSDNQLSNWRSLANLQSLAGTAGGRACDLTSLTAVSFNSGDPVIGGRCGKPGAVGILAELAGTWQLVGPKLPSSLARAGVEVLSLQPTDNGLSVLLGVSHGASKSLIAAWTSNGDWQWTTSPVLRVGPSDRVESFGPAAGGGFFVLFSGGSANKLEVLDDPGGRWDLLWPMAGGGEAVKRVGVALGDDGNAQARLRLDDLLREVEAGIAAPPRDRELLDALAEIRSGHLGVKPGVTDMAYAEAFRRAGIDLDILTPAEAAARLRARPAAVVLQVLPYLDSWSLVRRNDEQPAERWHRPWPWPALPTPTPIATGSPAGRTPGYPRTGRGPAGPLPGSTSRRAAASQHHPARLRAQRGR